MAGISTIYMRLITIRAKQRIPCRAAIRDSCLPENDPVEGHWRPQEPGRSRAQGFLILSWSCSAAKRLDQSEKNGGADTA